jgi:competence protein ComEC
MNWSEYPYLRIAMAFATGIFVFEYFDLGYQTAITSVVFTILLCIGVELKSRKNLLRPHLTGWLFLVLFFSLGCVTMAYRKYTDQFKTIEAESKEDVLLTGVVQENLKTSSKLRLLLKTKAFARHQNQFVPHSSNVIVQFGKDDSLAVGYLPGNEILIRGRLSDINVATNPESFDYGYFMRTKGILQQANVKEGDHKMISVDNFSLFRQLAEEAKQTSSETLHKYLTNPDVLGIAEALLLGKQTLISSDIYQDFADTGAIHVLSVSGLHVAIFISLFIWLFDRIKSKNRYFKLFKVISLILIVAFYVVLTGMSPSVLRSGFMVCLYILGKNYFKNTSTYNILAISAIILLSFDPYYLFQISFQFSYLSLISILYFQPKIKKWWLPPSKALRFFWDLVNVSLAAQILVFPLTIFYFHKFPMYFILSGIVAVPLVTILIYLGTVILVFEYFYEAINLVLAPIFQTLLVFLQNSISYLADLPYSKLDHLWVGGFILVLSYLCLLLMMIWIENRNFKIFVSSLTLCFIIIFYLNIRPILDAQKSELDIYDIYGGMMADGFIKDKVYTFKSSSITNKTENFVSLNNRIKHLHQSKATTIYKLDSMHLFKLNNKWLYFLKSDQDFKRLRPNLIVDYLVISKTKKSDPNYVLDKIKPKIVILDRNVPPWIIEKWETYDSIHLFKLHIIKSMGAFHSSL